MSWWSAACRAASVVVATLVIAAASVDSPSAQQKLTPGAFLADADQLLRNYSNGGAGMAQEIFDLVIADHAALDKIVGLVGKENRYQKIATGRGLARAVQFIVKSDQAFANRIQELINQTRDQDVILAFTIGINERELGTAGGGAGVGGGGSGGQTS